MNSPGSSPAMSSRPAWRHWQAEGSALQRVDYWKDVVCQAVLHVTMTPDEPGDPLLFDGVIQSRDQAGSRLVNFRSSAHRIIRNALQVNQGDDQYLMISLQCRGASHMEQRKGGVSLGGGDIGVIDSAQPFQLHFPDAIERRIVMLPRALLAARLPRFGMLDEPLRLGADDAVTSVMAHTMQVLTGPTEVGDADVQVLLANIADLLALRLRGARGANLPGRMAYEQLLRAIDRNLDVIGFTPAEAAARTRISLRTAHRLFQQYSEPRISLEQYIVDQRLARAHGALTQGRAASVSEAAFAAGFSDLSHFARRFKARFGVAPSSLLLRDSPRAR